MPPRSSDLYIQSRHIPDHAHRYRRRVASEHHKLYDINSSTTDISVTATIIDAVNGIARVSLTTTDTDIEAGALTYDVEYRDSTDSVVKTYQGTMTIKQDVA